LHLHQATIILISEMNPLLCLMNLHVLFFFVFTIPSFVNSKHQFIYSGFTGANLTLDGMASITKWSTSTDQWHPPAQRPCVPPNSIPLPQEAQWDSAIVFCHIRLCHLLHPIFHLWSWHCVPHCCKKQLLGCIAGPVHGSRQWILQWQRNQQLLCC